MNAEQLNKTILQLVKDRLPAGSNLTTELMNILFIGKEAIYRRIRGEVPFTFAEIATLSQKLGISLDHVVGNSSKGNMVFIHKHIRYSEPAEIDFYMLNEYLDILKTARQDPNSEMIYTANVFPYYISLKFDYLARFHSFKWIYQYKEALAIKPFHQLEFPENLAKIKKDIVLESMNIRQSHYIWDRHIFQHIVKDIQYFKSIHLLEENDVAVLKSELLELLEEMKVMTNTGRFPNGNPVSVYLANTHFDSTYMYVRTCQYKISLIGVFGLYYLSALEEHTAHYMKNWMLSLKRLSTLISESGEIERVLFFEEQTRIIGTL